MAQTPGRRIRSAKITHISLCKRGVNQQPVLLKSAGRVQFEALVKQGLEGLLTAVVYVPDSPDAEGDIASREVVKQMAHDFIANGAKVDIEHNLQALSTEQVRVAETFLIQKGDERFSDWKDYSGAPVDVTDAWAVILKVSDPELQRLYKAGDWNGVSMFGLAEVQPLTKSKEHEMDLAQLEAALAKSSAALLEGLVKALKPTPNVPAPAQPVEFEGDMFNPTDVANHQERVMFKSLDLSKPTDIAKWQAHLVKKAQAAQPADEQAKAKEIERLTAELRKLQGASNQPANGTPAPVAEVTIEGLEKSEATIYAKGVAMGKALFGTKGK